MHLTLHLTRACNLRCDYCYAPPRSGQGMTALVGKQAMDFARQRTEGSCGIVFFGGEPLLEKELVRELVGHGRRQEAEGCGPFHFKMTTNGLLLDDAFLDFSVSHDLLVAISFDGIKPAHDAHRHTPDGQGTYDLVLPRLQALLAARPYSSVLMVVNPDTVQWMAESVEFIIELGARYVIVSLNYAGPWTKRSMRELKRQYRRLGEDYVRWTLAEKKFYLSPFEVKLSSHVNRHCYHQERCELAERQLSVDPDGALYPCVQFTRAGRESEWMIGDVWSGVDEARKRRLHDRSQAEKEVCKTCAIKARCNHTCGCLNWQTTGSINEVSPALCHHERILTPIADRMGDRLFKQRSPLFIHKHYNAAYPVISLLEDFEK